MGRDRWLQPTDNLIQLDGDGLSRTYMQIEFEDPRDCASAWGFISQTLLRAAETEKRAELPSNSSQISRSDASMYGSSSHKKVFCICRKGPDGTSMIPCEGGCEDWFHGKCVNIQESEQHHVEKYICPNCTRPGLETMFKTGMAKQPGMYIHYTISEDRSGDQESVMSERLAALGSRDRHSEMNGRLAALGSREDGPRFKNGSLALLGRKSGFG